MEFCIAGLRRRLSGSSLAFAVICLSLNIHAGGPATEKAEFGSGNLPDGWSAVEGGLLSKTFPDIVAGIDLEYVPSVPGMRGEISIFARDGESQAESVVATVNTSSSGASFRFPDDSDNRSFRIATNGANLVSFTATWFDRLLDSPANFSAVAWDNESINISWDAVPGADRYRIQVWTNVITGASAGTEFWSEDFSRAPASESTTAIGTEKFNDQYSDTTGWECNQFVYPAKTAGTVRLGASEKAKQGALLTPDLPAGDWHLRFRAWRYSKDDGTDMPVMLVSGSVTSLVSVVSIDEEPGVPHEAILQLPTIADGDRIMLCSFTNSAPRVILDRVSLLSGYSEGVAEPHILSEATVADATNFTAANLPHSANVTVGITAYGPFGSASALTAGIEVDLANPPPRHHLNAIPVTSLESYRYFQDFSALDGITSGQSWYNGLSVPYWQAFENGTVCDKIYKSEGDSTSGRFYALASSSYAGGSAFGALVPGGGTYVWGVAFKNDKDEDVELSSISFNARQWGFKNTVTQNVEFAYLVTNELVQVTCESDGWIANEAWNFETPFATEAKPDPLVETEVSSAIAVDCGGRRIAPGEVVLLRWRFERPKNQKGSSAIIGIDDVEVEFARAGRGFVVSIVENKR